MKNLRLAIKIGILVVVMALTSVAIAIVGVRQLGKSNDQLNTLTDMTAGALTTTANARIELLRSLRWEKNAILVHDKAQAAEFAELARHDMDATAELRARLSSLVEAGMSNSEQKALSD